MMIYNVSNFQHFFQSLDKCGDNLTLVTPDGKAYDWKSNRSFLLSLSLIHIFPGSMKDCAGLQNIYILTLIRSRIWTTATRSSSR